MNHQQKYIFFNIKMIFYFKFIVLKKYSLIFDGVYTGKEILMFRKKNNNNKGLK